MRKYKYRKFSKTGCLLSHDHNSSQNNGYGSKMLEMIFNIAHTVNERYITLEALIERFDWYNTRGFSALIEAEVASSNPDGLVFMMADLLDEQLIEDFFDE